MNSPIQINAISLAQSAIRKQRGARIAETVRRQPAASPVNNSQPARANIMAMLSARPAT